MFVAHEIDSVSGSCLESLNVQLHGVLARLDMGLIVMYSAPPCAVVLGPLAIIVVEPSVIVIVGLTVAVPVPTYLALVTVTCVGAVVVVLDVSHHLPFNAVISQGEWGRGLLAGPSEGEPIIVAGSPLGIVDANHDLSIACEVVSLHMELYDLHQLICDVELLVNYFFPVTIHLAAYLQFSMEFVSGVLP